ncbi:hypothetical protein MKW94_010287, partial [Papaver nudicaule]|nr:hypothetical protein [Papaver nudicaule]
MIITKTSNFLHTITTFASPQIHHDSPNMIMSTAFVLSMLILVISVFFSIIKNKKQLPPGPRGLPLVGSLPFLDPELHTYFANQAQKFGPIFKLQLGNKLGIVISSPSLAKQVLKDQDMTFANRDVPAAGRAMTYGGQDIVWAPYGPEWRMLRKVCVRGMLGNQSMDAMHSLRHKEVRRMVQHVHTKIGSPVDVGEQMFLTMLNVITNMMWGGSSKGDDGRSRTTKIGAEFRQVVSDMTGLLGAPNVSDFFPSLARFDLQGIEKKMHVQFLRFDKIFDSIIEQRLKSEEEGGEDSTSASKDFLQILLKLKDDEDSKVPLTMNHLKALLM